MALSYTTTLRNNRLDEIPTAIGSNGLLRIYNGTPPANVGTALSGNDMLVELALAATSAPAASGAELTFNAITDGEVVETGTATFFRLLTSGAAAVVQGTVGTSATDIVFDSVSFVLGGNVEVTSAVITAGNP